MPIAKGWKLKCWKCNKLKNKKSQDPCNCWRPSKKTPEVQKILIDSFKEWMTVSQACLQAWINEKSLQNRVNEDEEFFRVIQIAKEYPNILAKNTWIKEIKSNWKAAESRLEKKDPEFKKTQSLDLDMKGWIVYLPMVEGEIIEPEALENEEETS